MHPEIVHAKVDIEAERELAKVAGIQSIPTIMAFRDGRPAATGSRRDAPAVLEDPIRQLKTVDVAEVAALIAAAEATAEA